MPSHVSRHREGPAGGRRGLLLTAAAALTLALAGCGDGPRAISGPPVDTNPATIPAPVDQAPAGRPTPQGGVDQVTQRISALTGGRIVCGRHTLFFSPGALARDTDITLIDATRKNGFVSAEVYPEGLHFTRRVTLQTNFADLADPAGYNMYWLVKKANTVIFINIGGQVSADHRGIIAVLEHFSTYAPAKLLGKAGW